MLIIWIQSIVFDVHVLWCSCIFCSCFCHLYFDVFTKSAYFENISLVQKQHQQNKIRHTEHGYQVNYRVENQIHKIHKLNVYKTFLRVTVG